MNYLEEAEKLEQMAENKGLDREAEAIVMQKAQQYRAKHEAGESQE